MRFSLSIFCISICLLWANVGSADTILLNETFTYPNGNLTSNAGWVAHSGSGSSAVQVSSGAIILAQGAGSREDVNYDLGQTMAAGDIWRFEFDVAVNGTANATNTYFAHFKDAGTGTLFNSRLFVAAPTSGGNFTFGIDENSGTTPGAVFNQAFNFGTTYRVFAEYNFDLGVTELWVGSKANGVITSTVADIAQPMRAMAFRQAGGNTSMVIDNLVVTAVPEPTAAGLLALTGVAGLAFRRRRS